MNTGIDEKDKKKIIAVLHALFPEAKIYLFGSRAHGIDRRGSDIDIALDAGSAIPDIDFDEARRLMLELSTILIVDLVDYHSVHKAMRESIDQTKIVWLDPASSK